MMRIDVVRFVLAVMCLGWLAAAGCGRAVIPSEYTTYVAEDGSFKCDAPAGWAMTGGGKNGNYNATFSSGGAWISVTVDVTGSLLADIAKSTNRLSGSDDAEALSPLNQVHELKGQILAEDLGNFKDLNTADVRLPIAPGKQSEYTGTGSLGSQQHGYWVTALLTSQRLSVTCQCPESEWQGLQPVFQRVIDSVARGR